MFVFTYLFKLHSFNFVRKYANFLLFFRLNQPELIAEVLENIVAEFNYAGEKCHPKIKEIKANSTDLSKFMLSGRQPLNATLKYFSRAESIALWDKYFVVVSLFFTILKFL